MAIGWEMVRRGAIWRIGGTRLSIWPIIFPQGTNLVTATVWNFGIYAPAAQITDRAAFLVQGDGAMEAGVSTPTGWMVAIEPGRIAVPRTADGIGGYMANGPGEELNAAAYDWRWNDPADPSGAWVAAASPMRENIYPSASRAGLAGETVDNYWQLVSDELPHMAYTPTDAGEVVRSDEPDAGAISCPAHRHRRQSARAFTAGPEDADHSLSATDGFRGKGASIRLTYAEALYDKMQQKGRS